MYKDNYKASLEKEMVDIVQEKLSPLALRYRYSDTPLEKRIPWRPIVLITGNYSSGKSTFINELIGCEVQQTGQAPTDDSFTVIAHSEDDDPVTGVRETHDGRYLLNDPEYPFERLKKYGQRLASHFCMKKVNAPFLKDLAIIDTPGMLDSISEKDRGYDYQAVIGDLAEVADLILVLFDPHKAGTVKETYVALRETLPVSTYEERVCFVMNRIDECTSMSDLLKVYGTLCWNLSQMTGRKDIPPIHLTFSRHKVDPNRDIPFLEHLENEREALKEKVSRAPDFRMEHLATFVESHAEKLGHLVEALMEYGNRRRRFYYRFSGSVFGVGLLNSAIGALILQMAGIPLFSMGVEAIALAIVSVLLVHLLPAVLVRPFLLKRFHQRQLADVDRLTTLPDQQRKDSWASVREIVLRQLGDGVSFYPLGRLKKDNLTCTGILNEGTREIREALKELSFIPDDMTPDQSFGSRSE